jgi:hypothetical protein
MGYQVGQVISRTVANVVVPQLLEDSPNNPYAEEVAFKELKKIQEEISTSNAKTLNDVQKQFLSEYRALVKEFADAKLDCFSEKVIPVQKLDIEFICTDQGAHKTIEDALEAALGDEITCHHINCDAIKQGVDGGDNMMVSLESINN